MAGRGEGNDWSEGSLLCGRAQGLIVQLGHRERGGEAGTVHGPLLEGTQMTVKDNHTTSHRGGL